MTQALLSARAISKAFGGRAASAFGPASPVVQAVSAVDLDIHRGRTLGVIGESGCGKSTLGRLLLRLEAPTAGEISFDGTRFRDFTASQQKEFRRRVQPVFQNPYSSLNPRMTVGSIVSEPLLATGSASAPERRQRVLASLAQVGLSATDANRFPAEFSGGQRQRIAIARAIASRPDLIILDEPVSSQDNSVRAQILNLLKDLQDENGMAFVLITHDLQTLRTMCDEVAVMYLGRIVERGPADHVCVRPLHPYSQALFSAALTLDSSSDVLAPLAGEPPSPVSPPAGCAFHPRCPLIFDPCRSARPELLDRNGRLCACHALA